MRQNLRHILCAASITTLLAMPGGKSLANTIGSFNLTWTDRLGVTHPLVTTQGTLTDTNPTTGVQTIVGSWRTDANGKLTFNTPFTHSDNSPLNLSVTVKAINSAGSAAADFNDVPFSILLPNTYSFNTNSTTTTYTPAPVDNTTDAGKAVGVMQGIQVVNNFYTSLGVSVPNIQARFAEDWGNSSYMSGNYMNLGYDSWGSWDVLAHEFSHGITLINSMEIVPTVGYIHSFNQDYSQNQSNKDSNNHVITLTAAQGTQLAWQEGIASYMGTSALNAAVPSHIAGMPAADSDSSYNRLTSTDTFTPDSYTTPTSFSVDLESRTGLSLKYQTDAQGQYLKDSSGNYIPVVDQNGNYLHQSYVFTGQGEGDELSVARVLWDLMDTTPNESFPRAGRTDKVSLGNQAVINLMKSAASGNNGRLIDLWKAARTAYGTTPQSRALLGDIFEANAVSSIPGSTTNGAVADGGATSSSEPTLAWTKQDSGHSTQFLVAIYSADWSTLEELSPTLTSTNWSLTDPLSNGTYNWVVISNSVMQSSVDFNDSYWSGAASFSIVPEPSLSALLGFTTLTLLLTIRPSRRLMTAQV